MNLAFASRRGLFLYPVLFFLGAVAAGMSLDQLTEGLGFEGALQAAHLSLMAYGLFIGSFTFFGKEVLDRLFGATQMILGWPSTQPLSNRSLLLLFFIKDGIYYLLTTFGPFGLGLLLGTALDGLSPANTLFFLVGAGASFATGLALSYLFATAYMRHFYLAVFLVVIVGSMLSLGFLGQWEVNSMLPGLAYHQEHEYLLLLVAWVLVGILAVGAAMMMPERLDTKRTSGRETYPASFAPTLKKFTWAHWLGPNIIFLLTKEWMDVLRSKTHYRMVFSLAFPLVIFTGLEWFLSRTLPEEASFEFNTLFYGGLVGFFTVMFYSWLNNVDNLSFYSTLPVSVSQVVKTKVVLFLLLTTALPMFYLFIIAWASDEMHLLPLAVLLLLVVSIYIVSYTAAETGLRTNSYLFDTWIMIKFSLASTLPLIAIFILTDLMDQGLAFRAVAAVVFILCGILLIAAAVFWGRIETKWGKEEFG